MARLAALAVLLALLIVSPASARADGLTLTLDQRLTRGIEGRDGMAIAVIAPGLRWRTTSSFELGVRALSLRTAGSSDIGAPAAGGWGGELDARMFPWTRSNVSPYLHASAGLLLFPRTPFLPGGDVYDGIISFGAGADVDLGAQLVAGARLDAVHLSNGQGLGPHNPAFDGYGFAVEVGYRLDRAARSAPAEHDGRRGRSSRTPGVALDAETGGANGVALFAARVLVLQRLSRHVVGVADLEGGSFGAALGEGGAGAVVHLGCVSAGAQGGYRRYAGAGIAAGTLQLEAHVTREVSLVGMGYYESSEAFGSFGRATAGGRVFPHRDVVLDIGVAFDRLGASAFDDDHADPYLAVGWRLPLTVAGVQAELMVERQASTLNLLALRLVRDAGADLRAFARHDGWRRLR